MPVRAIAVDWSGRKAGERQAIRLAEARDGVLVRVEGGRTRAEVVEHLIDELERDPDMVVGFDFSFSLPSWFLESLGASGAPELWQRATTEGERWLADCEPPFWGLPGRRRPPDEPGRPQLRRTDVETANAAGGLVPRSPFQISGAGSVGASSIRGIPHLTRLRAAGFHIWPWDELGPPAVVEIWTRIAIGDTVKSDAAARRKSIAAAGASVPRGLAAAAAESEDSFDAAMSALWLSGHLGPAIGTPASIDAIDLVEGRTWLPGG